MAGAAGAPVNTAKHSKNSTNKARKSGIKRSPENKEKKDSNKKSPGKQGGKKGLGWQRELLKELTADQCGKINPFSTGWPLMGNVGLCTRHLRAISAVGVVQNGLRNNNLVIQIYFMLTCIQNSLIFFC